jgi:glycosyltransferase involved in cell wall biosynthesis
MMHLFINSLAATAGGGLTYIRNVLPHLASQNGVRVTVALTSNLRKNLGSLRGVDFFELNVPVSQRLWFEQWSLPAIIRDRKANVLLSTGNFAIWRSPVPQILLSRNSIYLSSHFRQDLLNRGEYRAWIDTRLRSFLARKSIHWADVTVAPSEAFASELRAWSGAHVLAIHHGFDAKFFCQDSNPLPTGVEDRLRSAGGSLKLLFVSHYNYFRNFEVLIRALPLLRDRLAPRSVKLLLTCRLLHGSNPGSYQVKAAARLIEKLNVGDMILELGTIPYQQLHQVYARADVYTTPAYAETFAHPLVEAMASGIPVIASDLAVHREICGGAAAYFPAFSCELLAERVVEIISSPEAARRMKACGLERTVQFSWDTHVRRILAECDRLLLAEGG